MLVHASEVRVTRQEGDDQKEPIDPYPEAAAVVR